MISRQHDSNLRMKDIVKRDIKTGVLILIFGSTNESSFVTTLDVDQLGSAAKN